MFRIMRCALVFLLAVSMVNLRVFTRAMCTVAQSFTKHGVVPDVVPVAPKNLVRVQYPSGVEADEGNELSPTSVQDIPTVSYEANPGDFYTLSMVDPDAPSRAEPILREFNHWLVGNIPCDNVEAGETLSAYIGPAPPVGTGPHRYVFLVYKQPGKLTFDEPRLLNIFDERRAKFSIYEFATKYNLGNPIAGNFYQAQFSTSNLTANPLLL